MPREHVRDRYVANRFWSHVIGHELEFIAILSALILAVLWTAGVAR